MKELYLLRHGDTGFVDRYIGATDVLLSSQGIEEITVIQKYLQRYDFDLVISSPLRRCLQTCELLNLPHKIIIDDRIREIDFGCWEQKTFDEIRAADSQLVEQWTTMGSRFCFPGGEKIAEFINRMNYFSSHIQSREAKRILIVTHGGVIRHLICSFLNLSYDAYLYFSIQSGRLTTINLHSLGGVLTGLNRGDCSG